MSRWDGLRSIASTQPTQRDDSGCNCITHGVFRDQIGAAVEASTIIFLLCLPSKTPALLTVVLIFERNSTGAEDSFPQYHSCYRRRFEFPFWETAIDRFVGAQRLLIATSGNFPVRLPNCKNLRQSAAHACCGCVSTCHARSLIDRLCRAQGRIDIQGTRNEQACR